MKWDKELKRFIAEKSEKTERIFKHGTRSRYTFNKCRCEPCKAANSEYRKSYRIAYMNAGKDKLTDRIKELETKNRLLLRYIKENGGTSWLTDERIK